jgi:hypothetical protein
MPSRTPCALRLTCCAVPNTVCCKFYCVCSCSGRGGCTTPFSPLPHGRPPGLLQANVLGALAVMLVDNQARKPLIAKEPDCSTLFALAGSISGYSRWGGRRAQQAGPRSSRTGSTHGLHGWMHLHHACSI